MRHPTFALAAALIAALTTPAAAQAVSKTVNYQDLDLSTPAGQATLRSRVEGAIRFLCYAPKAPGLQEIRERHKCLQEAAADAERSMQQAAQSQAAIRVARTNVAVR
jgi:UrcA family protein